MFRVASQPAIVSVGSSEPLLPSSDHRLYMQTQVALIKSSYVLIAALSTPAVQGGILSDIEPAKRVEWLQEQIEVNAPEESEILEIVVSADRMPRGQAQALCEAVATAYAEEVVFSDHLTRLKPIDILKSSEMKLREEIRRKTDDYYALVTETGGAGEAEVRLWGEQIGRLEAEVLRLEDEQFRDPGLAFDERIETLRRRIEGLGEKVRAAAEDSTDLRMRRAHLEMLQAVQRRIAEQIKMLEVEASAPPRVTRIPGVELRGFGDD